MGDMLSLIENFDAHMRKELKQCYIVSESRLNNILLSFEDAAKRIKELTNIINAQQEVIEKLSKELASYSTQ